MSKKETIALSIKMEQKVTKTKEEVLTLLLEAKMNVEDIDNVMDELDYLRASINCVLDDAVTNDAEVKVPEL